MVWATSGTTKGTTMEITKLLTIGGLTSSVAAGAVAGALLFAPATSGAQEDGSAPTTQTEATGESDGEAPCHGGRHHRHHKARLAATAAEVIGIEVEALRAALEAGDTLAQVAADHGVSESDLVDGLMAGPVERIDQAVADGRITEDEAAEKKARLRERVTARINGERPDRSERSAPDRARFAEVPSDAPLDA